MITKQEAWGMGLVIALGILAFAGIASAQFDGGGVTPGQYWMLNGDNTSLSPTDATYYLDAPLDYIASSTRKLYFSATGTNPMLSLSGVPPLYIQASTTPPGGSMIDPVTGERNGTGCFRINSGAIDDTEGGRRLPGTIHLGTECTQGWGDAYIDVNDINVSSSLERRLMQFWYTNFGSGGGIGASIKITTRNSGSQTLNPQYTLTLPTAGTYSNGQSMRFDNTLTLSTSGITFNDFDILRMYNNSLTGPATGSVLSRYAMLHGSFALSNKVSSTVMIYGNRPSIASQAADNNIGLYMPKFTAGFGKRNWGVLSGERIGVASDTAIAFDETSLATNNHNTVTTYGDTTLTYLTRASGLDLTIDSVSSTVWYSTSTLHRLPQTVSSTFTVNQTSTFRGGIFLATTTPLTAPANTAGLYATGTAGTVELYAVDESGNSTLISPHNGNGEYVFRSFNEKTGRNFEVNMEDVIRWASTKMQEEGFGSPIEKDNLGSGMVKKDFSNAAATRNKTVAGGVVATAGIGAGYVIGRRRRKKNVQA